MECRGRARRGRARDMECRGRARRGRALGLECRGRAMPGSGSGTEGPVSPVESVLVPEGLVLAVAVVVVHPSATNPSTPLS
eukprot:332871-Rhodomonas_salina.1